MPTTLGVSIILTSLCLITYLDEFNNQAINRTLFTLSIFSWMVTMCDVIYHNNIFVYILFFGLLFFFVFTLNQSTGNVGFSVETAKETPINTTEFPFSGKKGSVIQKIKQNKYLGTIIVDNMPNQIIIYCEESLKPNDKFEVEGLKGFDIIAKKIN